MNCWWGTKWTAQRNRGSFDNIGWGGVGCTLVKGGKEGYHPRDAIKVINYYQHSVGDRTPGRLNRASKKKKKRAEPQNKKKNGTEGARGTKLSLRTAKTKQGKAES